MSSWKLVSLRSHSAGCEWTHAGCQNEGLRWVDSNGSDVVWMGLERCDLLRGVVVVYAQLEVVGA
jgi:hypothetical protein